MCVTDPANKELTGEKSTPTRVDRIRAALDLRFTPLSLEVIDESDRHAGHAGAVVGEVTSGTFSPTLKVGIALALLDSSISDGDEVMVDVRGKSARFAVVSPPFVESRPK